MLNDFNDLIYSIQMIKSVSVLLMVLGVILGLFVLVMAYIFACNTLKQIGRKANVKDDWMAYVPFAQDIYKLKIANKPMWQLCFFGSCGAVLVILVNLLIVLIGQGSAAALFISYIILFAWLLVSYYVNYMFYRELYKNFGFNPLLALITFIPGMQLVMLVLDILIAYKNDIQWKQKITQPQPVVDPPTRADGRITAVSGAYAGAVFSIRNNETISMGRDPMKCQVIFDDKNIEVSHMHCSIRYSALDNTYIVTDYSKNGTWRDDNIRLRPNVPNSLPAGTLIFLGSRKNVFRLG